MIRISKDIRQLESIGWSWTEKTFEATSQIYNFNRYEYQMDAVWVEQE